MKWVRDNTGRFLKRPHYTPSELDDECESVIEGFLSHKYGEIRYPIETGDLILLLEEKAVVDQFADLGGESKGELWGVTDFCPPAKPVVRISTRLSQDLRFENPFRTTITHEYGHVCFHGPLFSEESGSGSLFGELKRRNHSCHREQIQESKDAYDWAEWQARYCSGALLMPRGAVRRVVTDILKQSEAPTPQHHLRSRIGQKLIETIARSFGTSVAAASVRLAMLGFLTEGKHFQSSLLT